MGVYPTENAEDRNILYSKEIQSRAQSRKIVSSILTKIRDSGGARIRQTERSSVNSRKPKSL